jgi:MFS family permease
MALPTQTLRNLLLLGLLGMLGFLSMGFQLVASRLLAPYFGSSIIVWAYLISTFLLAFSIGSMLGGWMSRHHFPIPLRYLLAISFTAALGFAINTFAGRPILEAVESSFQNTNVSLAMACAALFLLPVASTSAFSPLCAEALSAGGITSGLASGLVYGISTIGNIAGVMATAFFLIPHFRLSSLLMLWLAVSVAEVSAFCVLLSRPVAQPQHAPHCEEGAEYAVSHRP